MPVLDYTVSELPYFKTNRIQGYDDQLKPYTMFKIFSEVHDDV